MSVSSWFTTAKEWVMSWFTDASKQRLLALLNGVRQLVEVAGPIVQAIDEQLKPFLNDKNVFLTKLMQFLIANIGSVEKAVALVNQLKDLPMADLLANVALEILKTKVSSNVAFSTLRLAIELAYNIYKTTK